MRRIAILGLFLTACTQDPTLVNPATFERPGAVAFVCFDSMTQGYVPLSACGPIEGAEPDDRYSMTALVTQTASGEVGAIDLRLHRTLDSDVRVPGYTFVRVGEVPSALVVPPEAPNVTYVANFGSRSVQWMDTARFRPDANPMSGVEDGAVVLPDGPVAMVSSAAGDALFVALPLAGAVLPIKVLESGVLEQPTEADLVPLAVPLLPQPFVAPPTEYGLSCGGVATRRVGGERRSFVSLGDEAEPVSLVVVDDVLLVADAALPVIHRFSIGEDGALSALEPLPTGVPVRRIAVTPEVPADVPGLSGPARYLYAIDATDQSVLVMDYTAGSETFGGIIPVRAGTERNDRLDLPADARSLGILTPGFPGSMCTERNNEGPTVLRGVFLAVGQTNGAMSIIDVLDLDAPCRVSAEVCEQEQTFVSRHSERIGSTLSNRDGFRIAGTPTLTLDGSPGQIAGDGSTSASLRLTGALGECPAFMGGAGFNICVSTDPYSQVSDVWTATYQDDFLSGGRGRFAGSAFSVSASDGRFCERGAIGRDDISASNLTDVDPELGYQGDALVITSPPTASRVESNPECARYVDPEDGREFKPIRFQILSAANSELELGAETVSTAFGLLDGTAPDYERVFRCYERTLFRYEVQVRKAYLVAGRDAGSVHRVIDTASGCRINSGPLGQPVIEGNSSTYRNRIAQIGRPFVNAHVAFTIDTSNDLSLSSESILTFNVTGAPVPLAADVGSRGSAARRPALVEQVVYNPVTSKLYALDSNSDGFVEYQLAPLTTEFIFE
ncbi:MAG: hypothetical protein AB8H86_30545 [Polyangiales bacterium]